MAACFVQAFVVWYAFTIHFYASPLAVLNDEDDDQPLSAVSNDLASTAIVPGTTRRFSSSNYGAKAAHSPGSCTGSDDSEGTLAKEKRLTIIYFDVPGRAEALRMAAVISNVRTWSRFVVLHYVQNNRLLIYSILCISDSVYKLGDKLRRLWLHVQANGTPGPTSSFGN